MHRYLIILILAACLPLTSWCVDQKHPNILFIAVDDLNGWVGHLGGHPQVKTPNIDKMAQRGISFSRAYCNAPLCNPSRLSLLSGIRPHKSGVFGNGERFRTQLPDAETLMQYLRRHGYSAKGGGKIFHGANRSGDPDSWDFYLKVSGSNQRSALIRQENLPPDAWAPWGPLNADDRDMFDAKVVDWAISELAESHEKPFFLACGFTKPHLPWFVPKKYFDLYPLEDIQLPPVLESDRDDLPPFGRKLAREVFDVSGARNFAAHGEDHQMVLKHGQWKRAVQAYLATISFVDHHIGRLMDELDKSPHSDNTYVVLWGDHGWHLGEKHHWRKHALWEVTTKTTLVIAGPDPVPQNIISDHLVSLIDLYPTLVELCGLPKKKNIDGRSIVPILTNPDSPWPYPVLTTFGKGNHSIRSDRWRYIRYRDGGEELYDHANDPNEWHNLAPSDKHQNIINQLTPHLPTD